MKSNRLSDELYSILGERGCNCRTVSVAHLKEVEDEFRANHDAENFNEVFYKERLDSFKFKPPKGIEDARCIIVVAIPQPIVAMIFTWTGKRHRVQLPPTYDVLVDAEIKRLIETILKPEGFSVLKAVLPWKTLAAHSGLIEYGRNNIGYIPGKGSFWRLLAFYTDWSDFSDQWDKPVLMNRCLKCRACVVACPTHAIANDRFLLHAERCLTFHNEHADPVPDYVASEWHHCLLGCMICQRVCPENKSYIGWEEERAEFSEQETSMILNGIPFNALFHETQDKLKCLCLDEDYGLLARNLGLLIN
jgi:epoxyqueuosine reductase